MSTRIATHQVANKSQLRVKSPQLVLKEAQDKYLELRNALDEVKASLAVVGLYPPAHLSALPLSQELDDALGEFLLLRLQWRAQRSVSRFIPSQSIA